MPKNLTFRAGEKALSIIKDEGLRQDKIKIIAGAAGGPKWLVMNHLDRVIFSQWLDRKNIPLFLIGASIGAWRFAAVSTKSPREAIEKFKHAYIHQSYRSKPTPAEVTATSAAILDTYLTDANVREVLHHPYLRLNIMAVRSKWPVQSDKKFFLAAGLALSFVTNIISRKWLRFFFERALFYDPRQIPPFADMDQFPIKRIALTEKNLKQALLASGSIPLVMSGVNRIQNAHKGTYRDAGLLDYHLDIPYAKDGSIVLFPHYTERIIPGWMDKSLPWRKPSRSNMDNVVLISPSPEFIDQLPFKKIPDRNDFYLFKRKQKDRIAYWNWAVDMGKRLSEEFMDTVGSDKIRKVIQPMTRVR